MAIQLRSVKRLLLSMAFLVAAGTAWGDALEVTISGVDGPVLANVRAHLGLVQAEGLDDLSVWRLRQMSGAARDEVRSALRPFGYYRPRVEVRLEEPPAESSTWKALIRIQPGDPVTVSAVNIELIGEGGSDPALADWRSNWPLEPGDVLVHSVYESAWQALDRLAQTRGYFDARFDERRVVVDPDRASAEVHLRFDTGPRYRFGSYSTENTEFSDRLMDRLTIIETDEPYHSGRLDQQRETLVRSGLFERVIVDPQRHPDDTRVDLDYRLETRAPNSYRATAGFGTDTGPRVQLGWTRHYLSSRGNRFELGFGAQQQNSEFVLRGEYQHPRGNKPSDFLTIGGLLRSEQDDFSFNDENQLDPVFERFNGRREQAELRVGRLQERRPFATTGPLEERIFIEYLIESFDAFRENSLSAENEALLAANPELRPFLQTETNTLALGANWRLPNISGSGFFAEGQVVEARLRAASESVGSDVTFAQAYVSGRWHAILGDRHKLIMRAEVGYTDVNTRELDLSLDDRQLNLSITELPELYRFQTGGDRTVRGYAFEALSTNRNGGNHIFGATAEYEFRVAGNWSVAAFYDIGNAFNDWSDPKLKRGIGAGIRWYSVIGPVQLDIAQALDDAGQPLRIHFTIGTRLL
jgi:translocation and assembly module TamA